MRGVKRVSWVIVRASDQNSAFWHQDQYHIHFTIPCLRVNAFLLVPRIKLISEEWVPSHSYSPKRKWYLGGRRCSVVLWWCPSQLLGLPALLNLLQVTLLPVWVLLSDLTHRFLIHSTSLFYSFGLSQTSMSPSPTYTWWYPNSLQPKLLPLASKACGTCVYIPPVGGWQVYISLTSLLIILYCHFNTYRSNSPSTWDPPGPASTSFSDIMSSQSLLFTMHHDAAKCPSSLSILEHTRL